MTTTQVPDNGHSRNPKHTTTEPTTNEKLMQLQNLLGQAGELHYKRIKLAKEIIDDAQWVLTHFGGNLHKAEALLEKQYFGDLCGAISFRRLLLIYERFPDIETWRKHHFNLTHLSATMDAERDAKKSRGSRWSVTQKEWDDLESDRDRHKKLLANERKEKETLLQENERLKKQIAELNKEIARLQGRNEEPETLIAKRVA